MEQEEEAIEPATVPWNGGVEEKSEGEETGIQSEAASARGSERGALTCASRQEPSGKRVSQAPPSRRSITPATPTDPDVEELPDLKLVEMTPRVAQILAEHRAETDRRIQQITGI
jgi:hypothetical protein